MISSLDGIPDIEDNDDDGDGIRDREDDDWFIYDEMQTTIKLRCDSVILILK